MRWLLPAFALVFSGALLEAAPAMSLDETVPVSHVSYLYVESNEEGAAGGHVALRLGDTVYHYQRLAGGPFVLDRMPFASFLFSYSRLQNRNVHELPLPVDSLTAAQIADRLNERVHLHRRTVVGLERLRLRLRGLGELRSHGSTAIYVPATGTFIPAGGRGGSPLMQGASDVLPCAATDAVMDALSEAVMEQARQDMVSAFARSEYPSVDYTSAEAVESLQEAYLEELIVHGFVDAPGAFAVTDVPFSHGTGTSGGGVEGAMESLLAAWRRRIVAVASSDRTLQPDRARTVLEMLVLLRSLALSRERGVLILPVMAGTDGRVPVLHEDPTDGGLAFHRSILRKSTADFLRRTSSLSLPGANCDDGCAAGLLAEWNGVLVTGARYQLARRYGSAAILDHGTLMDTPSLGRFMTVRRNPPAGEGDGTSSGVASLLEREWAEVSEQERRLAEKAAGMLDYSLVGKNCVTELLRDLEPAIGRSMATGGPSTEAGGPSWYSNPWRSIPWFSMSEMRRRFPVASVKVHLSYRNELLQHGRAARDRLTVTSPHYRFNDRDSWFLFFSEDAGWLRPVAGLANLVPATAQALAGVVALPVAGPSLLRRGFRGILFSGAEISGMSIRKGTFRSSNRTYYDAPSVRTGEP